MTNRDGEGFHIGYELFRWGNRVDGELDNGNYFSWDADPEDADDFENDKGAAVINVEYDNEEDGQLEKYYVTWERVE